MVLILWAKWNPKPALSIAFWIGDPNLGLSLQASFSIIIMLGCRKGPPWNWPDQLWIPGQQTLFALKSEKDKD
jgi:hypothetical protein